MQARHLAAEAGSLLTHRIDVVSAQEGELAIEEMRALEAVDVSVGPDEADSILLDKAAAQFRPEHPDRLRLLPPEGRSRNHQELQARLMTLVGRLESSDAPMGLPTLGQARAVEAMVSALSSLARIHLEIDGARQRRGR